MRDTNGAEKALFVYLETFGCQMNENDSTRMLGFLKDLSYRRTEDPGKADLIVLNTCSIRDKAEHKVYSRLGRFKDLKSDNPGLVIGVAGCVAQQAGESLFKRAPYLDLVLGPQNIHKLKDILAGISKGRRRIAATSFNGRIDAGEYAYNGAQGVKAFVSVMRGCDNFCSYCIVPYTRGREVSRDAGDILGEIERLAGAGVKEISLIGQNVNSYGAKGADTAFPELIRKSADVPGVARLRFMTSHPKDISDELIGLFATEPKLCKHIHLPVQSGSDNVLEMMKRRYTVAEYLLKVEKLKKACPGIAVTTDIIVGFPGETENDFDDTMRLVNAVRFDNIFSFMYSPRPGTSAAKLPGALEGTVKSERLRVLQERQRLITIENNAKLVGATLEVLVEGRSRVSGNELTGRSTCNRIVNFTAQTGASHPVMAGALVEVMVTGVHSNSLRGRAVVFDGIDASAVA